MSHKHLYPIGRNSLLFAVELTLTSPTPVSSFYRVIINEQERSDICAVVEVSDPYVCREGLKCTGYVCEQLTQFTLNISTRSKGGSEKP